VADVLRLVRQENWPHVDLGRLTGAGAESADPARLSGQLFEALRQGDVAAGRSLIDGAYQAGLAVERLADEVIAPAMARVGHGWEEGRLDVYHEHRGTQVCLEALLELKGRLRVQAGRDRPAALGGGPEQDPYQLANVLAQMVL